MDIKAAIIWGIVANIISFLFGWDERAHNIRVGGWGALAYYTMPRAEQ
jgi:hypothetical protein